MVPPLAFKRKVNKKIGCTAYFSCNSCEKLGFRGITASAIKISENEDGRSEFELVRLPENHNF